MAVRRGIERRRLVQRVGHPARRALPLLAGGRLARPFRLSAASPLGSLMGTAITAANIQVPLLSDELGEAVLRNLRPGRVGVRGLRGRRRRGAAVAAGEPTRRGQRHVDLHVAARIRRPQAYALRSASRRASCIGCSNRPGLVSPGTCRAIGCSSAATRWQGQQEPAVRFVDIAFGWGFNSMATFYRAFTNEFGGRRPSSAPHRTETIGIAGASRSPAPAI